MMRGMGGQSPSEIVHYLKGIDFPASKDELVEYAEENGAPQEIVDVLEDLPEDLYTNMTDLIQSVVQVQ